MKKKFTWLALVLPIPAILFLIMSMSSCSKEDVQPPKVTTYSDLTGKWKFSNTSISLSGTFDIIKKSDGLYTTNTYFIFEGLPSGTPKSDFPLQNNQIDKTELSITHDTQYGRAILSPMTFNKDHTEMYTTEVFVGFTNPNYSAFGTERRFTRNITITRQ
jgi:hypothetical protein